MAKLECSLNGNFDTILNDINENILHGSVSASYEDGSDFNLNGVRCAVRVYERYSFMGGNRVSLNVTLFGDGNSARLSAVTSGGSQAMFFKMNTMGENSFLEKLEDVVRKYR